MDDCLIQYTKLHVKDIVMLFFRIIKILIKDLDHREHVHFILFEYRSHRFVADDLTLVGLVLEALCVDVCPNFLHYLGTRELFDIIFSIDMIM